MATTPAGSVEPPPEGSMASAHLENVPQSDGDLPGEIIHELAEHGIDLSHEVREAVKVTVARYYSGPLPPAEVLAGYDRIRPGSADQLFTQFELQANHRRELERLRVSESESRQHRAQLFAFLIALAGIGVSGTLAYLGASSSVAIAVVIASIGGPGAATILGRLAVHLDRRANEVGTSRDHRAT